MSVSSNNHRIFISLAVVMMVLAVGGCDNGNNSPGNGNGNGYTSGDIDPALVLNGAEAWVTGDSPGSRRGVVFYWNETCFVINDQDGYWAISSGGNGRWFTNGSTLTIVPVFGGSPFWENVSHFEYSVSSGTQQLTIDNAVYDETSGVTIGQVSYSAIDPDLVLGAGEGWVRHIESNYSGYVFQDTGRYLRISTVANGSYKVLAEGTWGTHDGRVYLSSYRNYDETGSTGALSAIYTITSDTLTLGNAIYTKISGVIDVVGRP